MRIPAKRAIALPVAVLSAVALSGVVASTASADVAIVSGSGTVTVNGSFVQTLDNHNIECQAKNYQSVSDSETDNSVAITFAATGGDANVSTFSGTVSYSGDIICTNENTDQSVDFSSLIFDLGGATVYGQASAADGEIPLLDLAGTQYGNIAGNNQTYTASDLVVDAAGADYLNNVLGTTVFTGGMDVGSFTTSWVL